MPILKIMSRMLSLAVALTTVLALSACFTSQAPLITSENADYPFQRITFISVGDDGKDSDAEQITIARRGDAYVELNKSDEEKYLFVHVEGDLYIGQVSEADDDGKNELLYGVVHIQDDDVLSILSPMCSDTPEGVLKTTGIAKENPQSANECTVASLDQLKALARLLVGTDIERDAYRIVELVK